MAWTPDAAYVAIYWNEDRFAEALYRGSKIPIGDEPILAVQGIKDGGFVRFIDGKSQKSGLIELVSLKMGVRNTAIIRIPAKAFGLLSIASNQKLKLDLSLQTRSRAYSIQWHCNELTSP